MKKIKNLLFVLLMVAGAFLFMNKNVNAEEFNPKVIGTLTKAGDSVKVSNANGYKNEKYIKYISSTDDLMYVYTDAKANAPVVYVYDKNGNWIQTYDDNGKLVDPANTGNKENVEFFVKLKKGEVYYFSTFISSTTKCCDYNVKLTKATKKPNFYVMVYNNKIGYKFISEVDLSKNGLTYDKDNFVLTMNNANIPYEICVYTLDSDILSDGLFEVKVLGNNTVTVDAKSLFYSNIPVVFTGNGKLTFKTETENYVSNHVIGTDNYYLADESMPDLASCRIEGPTIESSVNTKERAFEFNDVFTMNSGKIDYSGVANGVISASIVNMNGGTISISMKGFAEVDKLNYNFAIYGDKYVGINDGTIIVKYFETEVKAGNISARNVIETENKICINGGNIYVIIPDTLKNVLKVNLAGAYKYADSKYVTVKISDKANIQIGNEVPKAGETIEGKNYIYKITKAGSKNGKVGEVTVTGLNKKSLKNVKIATKITVNGVTYKVTSISAKAFKGNKKIASVVIGKNVKSIGANAFANCKNLKKVTINSKVLKKVGKNAFYRKSGKKLTIKVPKAKKNVYKKLLKKAKTNKYVVK
ncbi:Leucine rich repeat-containing protein [Eubacterium uniforme]|uniref:Leucine rich repeat-containing protein n=1 Tax=Eubacterium uniforme TaxID=39495 RepID=A0A1T4VL55_9FIRM|nr:leucine-rich repeat protein [Eubacterium uniforme]SKA65659.1 Leucine rich repeat-containing protein [Eubacterium uniforme]